MHVFIALTYYAVKYNRAFFTAIGNFTALIKGVI